LLPSNLCKSLIDINLCSTKSLIVGTGGIEARLIVGTLGTEEAGEQKVEDEEEDERDAGEDMM
jgi:hypothetical protein